MSKASLEFKSVIEDFLFREAEYMDLHQYEQWLALWVEDNVKYWVPCNEDFYEPASHVSLIYDDSRSLLKERVLRLKSKFNHTQSPKSRLAHVISNIRVSALSVDGVVEVNSTFSVAEARPDRLTIWAGRQSHVLVSHGDDFRIREKRIYLVNNDNYLPNLSFLI